MALGSSSSHANPVGLVAFKGLYFDTRARRFCATPLWNWKALIVGVHNVVTQYSTIGKLGRIPWDSQRVGATAFSSKITGRTGHWKEYRQRYGLHFLERREPASQSSVRCHATFSAWHRNEMCDMSRDCRELTLNRLLLQLRPKFTSTFNKYSTETVALIKSPAIYGTSKKTSVLEKEKEKKRIISKTLQDISH